VKKESKLINDFLMKKLDLCNTTKTIKSPLEDTTNFYETPVTFSLEDEDRVGK
jgi:hypothetical protein